MGLWGAMGMWSCHPSTAPIPKHAVHPPGHLQPCGSYIQPTTAPHSLSMHPRIQPIQIYLTPLPIQPLHPDLPCASLRHPNHTSSLAQHSLSSSGDPCKHPHPSAGHPHTHLHPHICSPPWHPYTPPHTEVLPRSTSAPRSPSIAPCIHPLYIHLPLVLLYNLHTPVLSA